MIERVNLDSSHEYSELRRCSIVVSTVQVAKVHLPA